MWDAHSKVAAALSWEPGMVPLSCAHARVCVCVCVCARVRARAHGRVGAVREREFQLSVPWASDRTMWNILVFSKVGPSPGEPAGEM